MGDPLSQDAVLKVIDANEAAIKISGVTKTYVGWAFKNDWITNERAIVVLTRAADRERVEGELPDHLEGIPLQVRRDPRPPRVKADNALMSFEAPVAYNELFVEPEFPGQKVFDDALTNELFFAKKPTKPKVEYQMPAGIDLNPGPTKMDLILHVSPEQGWAQLKPFLEDAKDDFTVGMYELTAPHIEEALIGGLTKSGARLTMTLDSPPEKKGAREQTVETTEEDLEKALGDRLDFAWALAGLGKEAPAREFPTSYHIKVAVTGDKFWLSSGNWNTSNQPDVDPNDQAALKEAAKKRDRDWHVICTSSVHADIFRKYLQTDYEVASKAAESKVGQALLAFVPQAVIQEEDIDASGAIEFFKPLPIDDAEVEVHALFTPRQYRGPIIELIQSAKTSFDMQTQYVHPSNPGQDDEPEDGEEHTHTELIDALVQASKNGVTVRLITSEWQDHQWIERLQDSGFDCVNLLKIQPHVHNKGMVVDGQTVVVSSQNWSPDGTGPNRDAGLVIYSKAAAGYFGQIFDHDWKNMAAYKVLK